MQPETERFLSGIRNPISVSNLITALAAGTVLQVEHIPVDTLPSVVLLATIGLRSFNQQIIDDYQLLLEKMEAAFKDTTLTHRDFYHPDLWLVSSISQMGPRAEYFLDSTPEAEYMFTVYAELINADLNELFKEIK